MTRVPTNAAPASLHGAISFQENDELAGFREQFPGWPDDGRPTYFLPEAMIAALAEPDKRWRGLSPEEVRREGAFSRLCRNQNAVGLWGDQFVRHPFVVTAPTPPDNPSQFQGVGWTAAQVQTALQLVGQVQKVDLRLKGYLGWLATDPGFTRERDEIQQLWSALAVEQRGTLPLQRPLRAAAVPEHDAALASPQAASFFERVEAFFDRWGLVELTTWDLPLPQGPMLPSPLPAGAQALPRHGIHVVLPVHYPLAGNDDLLALLREQQVQQAQVLGLDKSLAGLPHHEAWARMFDVDFLERAILSRFPGRAPLGLVRALVEAMSQYLNVGEARIDRLRKEIRQCRGGHRDRLKWLRT